MNDPFELLWSMSKIDSPSGDEGPLCDFIEALLPSVLSDIRLTRIGDSLVVWRGDPKTALFSHIDTTGFTLGNDKVLVPLGSPTPKDGDPIRQTDTPGRGHTVARPSAGVTKLRGAARVEPGTRWVYDKVLELKEGVICGPYLDNRAGVWAALQVLMSCRNAAVAFTVGEESSGHGALVCGEYLYKELQISQSFISDITWHTKHIRCGSGPAISLRDRFAPRQRFLDKVLQAAESSGIVFQREIESDGGSDGSYLLKSAIPMDWVFIGAPEEHAHSSAEKLHAADLLGMVELIAHLVNAFAI
jgi:putative aminopeptidase FrvX